VLALLCLLIPWVGLLLVRVGADGHRCRLLCVAVAALDQQPSGSASSALAPVQAGARPMLVPSSSCTSRPSPSLCLDRPPQIKLQQQLVLSLCISAITTIGETTATVSL
jgi:hypothetical protein